MIDADTGARWEDMYAHACKERQQRNIERDKLYWALIALVDTIQDPTPEQRAALDAAQPIINDLEGRVLR